MDSQARSAAQGHVPFVGGIPQGLGEPETLSVAQGRRSTLWALLLLLRLVVCLPIYAWGVLMALLAGSTARGILRVEQTLWAWTDTIYRWAGVETGRRWPDAR